MKKYINYIKEDIQEVENVMAGKHGFHIFLEIINDNDINWTKKSHLNTGEYAFFFRSEHIIDNQGIAEQLELKKSLKTAYLTLRSILNMRLCFYFGVKNSKLEYGFYDETAFTVYKIGIFEVNNLYFKKQFPKEANLRIVKNALENINLRNIDLLHKIRTDMSSFWPDIESKTEIIDERTIRRTLPLEYFKVEDRDLIKMMDALEYNIRIFDWTSEIHSYVDIDEEKIYMFVKLI